MKDSMFEGSLEPKFYSDATSFLVTLYNLNYQVPIEKTVVSREKQLFEDEKTVVSGEIQSFEHMIKQLNFRKPTENNILMLYQYFGTNSIFSQADVIRITGITSSPAGELIKKMKIKNLIEEVNGQGKGKYRFR